MSTPAYVCNRTVVSIRELGMVFMRVTVRTSKMTFVSVESSAAS